jgi:hypothetical protein
MSPENEKLIFAVEENMLVGMREYAAGTKVNASFPPEKAKQIIADIRGNRQKRKEDDDKLS